MKLYKKHIYTNYIFEAYDVNIRFKNVPHTY